MAWELCYADAVRLLGGHDEKVVRTLDALVGGLVGAASATGAGFVLNLFNPKSQLVKLSSDLVQGLRERASGLSRVGRSERLAAATRSWSWWRISRLFGLLADPSASVTWN